MVRCYVDMCMCAFNIPMNNVRKIEYFLSVPLVL